MACAGGTISSARRMTALRLCPDAFCAQNRPPHFSLAVLQHPHFPARFQPLEDLLRDACQDAPPRRQARGTTARDVLRTRRRWSAKCETGDAPQGAASAAPRASCEPVAVSPAPA
eukprot:4423758-Prorocentrum_lima.AAC.1